MDRIVEPSGLADADRFLSGLFADQDAMTAVERFSAFHDTGDHRTETIRQYRAPMPATSPRAGEQYAFEVDLDLCSGCKACVVACNTMNALDPGETWRFVGTLSSTGASTASSTLPVVSVAAPEPRIQHVTTACHHCLDPGCLSGCPVKAYVKDPHTGVVRHLDDQCIGCKYCTMMCPYEVPQYNERLGIVRKCDMCHQRLAVGEPPACVQSCPNAAIRIVCVTDDEIDAEVADRGRLLPEAPSSRITRPSTRYRSSRTAGRLEGMAPQDRAVDEPQEAHWPLVIMLVMTQASWGVLATALSVVLVGWALGSGAGVVQGERMMRAASFVALAMAMIGLSVAPLHLGQPLRAWRVFLGVRTSWLSREALVFGFYAGLLGLLSWIAWGAPIPALVPLNGIARAPWLTEVVSFQGTLWFAGAATVAGAVALASSAMVYVATRRRMWNARETFIRFFGTAAALGMAGVMPISMAAGAPASLTTALIVGIAVVVVGKAWVEPGVLRRGAVSPGRAEGVDPLVARSARLVRGSLRRIRLVRIASASIAVGLLAVTASSPAGGASMGWATIAVCGLVVAELAERALYFASVVTERMPGTLK